MEGKGPTSIAEALGCHRSLVYLAVERYERDGMLGLLDQRVHNGKRKVTLSFKTTIATLLRSSPRVFGYARPTWTRELLCRVAWERVGLSVSVSTMSRVLASLGARRGRPKPAVRCPWPKRKKAAKLGALTRLLRYVAESEVVLFADEVDIHLNPKIGPDWMLPGQQKKVMTPGKNEKAYVAGALNARDGQLTWVGGTSKTSGLFVALLERLCEAYPHAERIHLIVDNYIIHSSGPTQAALARLGRVRLHFLPPYCPDANRIERLWQDLHANVTRNHQHAKMGPLCQDVRRYLDAVSPWRPAKASPRLPVRLVA
jgi:transposase